ncbi:hypothetical protein EZS27_029275, partial [termite gut metagenome]
AKGAFSEEEANARFTAWQNNKQSGLAALKVKQQEAQKAEEKARFEAEKKVNEVRAKALAAKKVVEVSLQAAPSEEPVLEEKEVPVLEITPTEAGE